MRYNYKYLILLDVEWYETDGCCLEFDVDFVDNSIVQNLGTESRYQFYINALLCKYNISLTFYDTEKGLIICNREMQQSELYAMLEGRHIIGLSYSENFVFLKAFRFYIRNGLPKVVNVHGNSLKVFNADMTNNYIMYIGVLNKEVLKFFDISCEIINENFFKRAFENKKMKLLGLPEMKYLGTYIYTDHEDISHLSVNILLDKVAGYIEKILRKLGFINEKIECYSWCEPEYSFVEGNELVLHCGIYGYDFRKDKLGVFTRGSLGQICKQIGKVEGGMQIRW